MAVRLGDVGEVGHLEGRAVSRDEEAQDALAAEEHPVVPARERDHQAAGLDAGVLGDDQLRKHRAEGLHVCERLLGAHRRQVGPQRDVLAGELAPRGSTPRRAPAT